MNDVVPLVVFSQRLAPVTEWEESITRRSGARMEMRSLADHDELRSNAADASALIVGAVEPLDDDTFRSLPNLRLVTRRGVGLDNVDVEAATRHGVVVTHVPDGSVEEVSDHALALALALSRRTLLAHRHYTAGRLADARVAVDASKPLRDSTFGVLGYGRIGRRAAEKASAAFGRVLVHDPYLTDTTSSIAEFVDLRALVAGADVLSVHVPLTHDTKGVIGRSEIEQMPPGAIVVNSARAGVVDEDALEEAIVAGALGGAGLDVTDEPQRWLALANQGANVLVTGHTGARGSQAQTNLRRSTADQVVAFLTGKRPQHVVNPAALDLQRRS